MVKIIHSRRAYRPPANEARSDWDATYREMERRMDVDLRLAGIRRELWGADSLTGAMP